MKTLIKHLPDSQTKSFHSNPIRIRVLLINIPVRSIKVPFTSFNIHVMLNCPSPIFPRAPAAVDSHVLRHEVCATSVHPNASVNHWLGNVIWTLSGRCVANHCYGCASMWVKVCWTTVVFFNQTKTCLQPDMFFVYKRASPKSQWTNGASPAGTIFHWHLVFSWFPHVGWGSNNRHV